MPFAFALLESTDEALNNFAQFADATMEVLDLLLHFGAVTVTFVPQCLSPMPQFLSFLVETSVI